MELAAPKFRRLPASSFPVFPVPRGGIVLVAARPRCAPRGSISGGDQRELSLFLEILLIQRFYHRPYLRWDEYATVRKQHPHLQQGPLAISRNRPKLTK
jgi:hypothetical protein